MLVPHESSRSETESTENLIFFGRGNYLRKFRELQQTMPRNNKRSLFVALPFASFDFHNSRLSSRREKRWRWHFLEPSEKRICSELYLAQSDFCLYLTATNGLFDLLLFANENRTNWSEFEIKQDMVMECLYSISNAFQFPRKLSVHAPSLIVFFLKKYRALIVYNYALLLFTFHKQSARSETNVAITW